MSEIDTTPTEVIDGSVNNAEDANTEIRNSGEDVNGENSINDEPEVFTAEYVAELRQENGRYRQRARDAETERDAYAQRLHTELVRATDRLADPTDLEFDAEHLAEDPSRLRESIDELLTRKPHLAQRRPAGDIGQGPSGSAASVDLAALLRGKAG